MRNKSTIIIAAASLAVGGLALAQAQNSGQSGNSPQHIVLPPGPPTTRPATRPVGMGSTTLPTTNPIFPTTTRTRPGQDVPFNSNSGNQQGGSQTINGTSGAGGGFDNSSGNSNTGNANNGNNRGVGAGLSRTRTGDGNGGAPEGNGGGPDGNGTVTRGGNGNSGNSGNSGGSSSGASGGTAGGSSGGVSGGDP